MVLMKLSITKILLNLIGMFFMTFIENLPPQLYSFE